MPQSLSRVFLHVVFSTKNRTPLLQQPLRQELHPYLGGVLKNNGCHPVRMGGVEDHVHLLFGLSRTITIAKAIELLKTKSSHWLNSRLVSKLDFHWQNGYGAFSVGESEVDRIVRYIQNQEEHHRKYTFQKEYRKQLQQSGIEFDERYVWD